MSINYFVNIIVSAKIFDDTCNALPSVSGTINIDFLETCCSKLRKICHTLSHIIMFTYDTLERGGTAFVPDIYCKGLYSVARTFCCQSALENRSGATKVFPWRSYPMNITWLSWWRHQMETFSALLAICAGNSQVPGEFLHKGQWRGTLMFCF